MLRAQFCVRTLSGFCSSITDRTNASISLPNSFSSTSSPSLRLGLSLKRRRLAPAFLTVSSKLSPRRSGSGRGDDRDHEYLEASLLRSETISHYQMRHRGFQEEWKWSPFGQLVPDSRANSSRLEPNSIGLGFLRRFQTPTIFLKISCDGDFVLPILVGEFAIEKLMDGLHNDSDYEEEEDDEHIPDQFQLARNLVEKLGYEVMMVRITKRVVNTYYARLYFSKPGEKDILSVDARPSDAINLAIRCKVPIYVNKQIVMKDAVKIGYGMSTMRDTKSTYDVILDSAVDGPDFLSEELGLVRNMNLAVKEERYNDAAMWRDKLMRLRNSSELH